MKNILGDEFSHVQSIYFDFAAENTVAIDDAKLSIEGMAGLLHDSFSLIQEIYPYINIGDFEIYFVSSETGSLRNKILVRLFFDNEEQLLDFAEKVGKGLGLHALRKTVAAKPKLIASVSALLISGAFIYYFMTAQNQPHKRFTFILTNILKILEQSSGMMISGDSNVSFNKESQAIVGLVKM